MKTKPAFIHRFGIRRLIDFTTALIRIMQVQTIVPVYRKAGAFQA
jgi:hypothetical protein